MANVLAAAVKGAAGAGAQYTQKLISENMQKRRDERLAGIRSAETAETRAYTEDVTAKEHERQSGLLESAQEREDVVAERKLGEAAGIKTLEHERGLLETTHQTDEDVRKAKELSKAGITSTGKSTDKTTGAATNAFKKYNEMLSLGKDKDTAFALAYNSIRTLKDEWGGDEQLVDLASNQLVGMIKEDEGTGKKTYEPTLGAKPESYSTKEEVRDAYRAGNLSRDEAKKLISGM